MLSLREFRRLIFTRLTLGKHARRVFARKSNFAAIGFHIISNAWPERSQTKMKVNKTWSGIYQHGRNMEAQIRPKCGMRWKGWELRRNTSRTETSAPMRVQFWTGLTQAGVSCCSITRFSHSKETWYESSEKGCNKSSETRQQGAKTSQGAFESTSRGSGAINWAQRLAPFFFGRGWGGWASWGSKCISDAFIKSLNTDRENNGSVYRKASNMEHNSMQALFENNVSNCIKHREEIMELIFFWGVTST